VLIDISLIEYFLCIDPLMVFIIMLAFDGIELFFNC